MDLYFTVFGDKPADLDVKAAEVLNGIDSADNWTWEIDATAVQFVTGVIAHWEGHVSAQSKMPGR